MEYMKRGITATQRGELSNEQTSSISLNKGESIDAYKEKVEHFKVLVMHLQNELQANKMRKEGAETVSKLLQESKKEVMLLQRKVKTLESAIRNLQSRLELHGMSTEITLQDGETYIPSHSKQLLDNLTRENTRLRALIRSASGDPEELDRLQKEIQNLNSKNNEAELYQEELQAKIRELEDVLNASDNSKDTTIKRLRDELEHANQELSKRGDECVSLAEERTTLQNQLKEVAQKCQELAQKLERHRAGARSPTETELKQAKSVEANETLVKLQEENTHLNDKVKEITEMNKRWQEYNQQRETNMIQLQKELAELKDKERLKDANFAKQEQAMQEQLHRILEDTQTHVRKANEDAARAKQDRDQYKQRLDESNRNMTQMAEMISQLQRQAQNPVAQGAEAEIIEALKQQIQICTEDFESERKDREKVQTKLHRALSECEHLRKEVENLKKERLVTTPQFSDQRQYNDPFYHYQLPGPHGNFGGENLAARGVSAQNVQYYNKDRYNVIDGASADYPSDRGVVNTVEPSDIADQTQVVSLNSKDSEERFCSLKSLSSISDHSKNNEQKAMSISPRASTASPRNISPSSRNSDASGRVSNDARTRNSVDILKCPKCDKEYSSDEHADLLEHIEICCE